jgi:hypothetical protein
MKTSKLAVFLYEKVVLAVIISAVSAALLYTYNINSKAFDVAEAQSKGYSALALKLRDLCVTGTIKVGENVRVAYLRGSRTLPDQFAEAIDAVSVEMSQIADLIATKAPNSAKSAKEISRLLNDATLDFQTEFGFNKPHVDEFQKKLEIRRLKFIQRSEVEIKKVALDEFNTFVDDFEKRIPFLLRPKNVWWSTLGLFVISTGVLIWVVRRNKEAPTASGRTPAKRR